MKRRASLPRGSSRTARGAVVSALVAAFGGLGCHAQTATVLLVTVTLSGSVAPVARLDVTLTGPAGTSTRPYAGAGQPIPFPTTLSAQVPAHVTGDLTIDVNALDADGHTVAHGRNGPFTLRSGSRQNVVVSLDCGGGPCIAAGADAGSDAGADAGAPDAAPNCGNGRIDENETCDVAIPAGTPGACPAADCDDGLACTTDLRQGAGCGARCDHVEITKRAPGDRCCPAGATSADDADCAPGCGDGVVGAGETCDVALAPGANGACPTAGACNDRDACTQDLLVSAGTCAAVCAHVAPSTQSGSTADGCCPVGAWNEVDTDCPLACGNGRVEGTERCDLGLPPGAPGGCPASCDDGNPCTLDLREGLGCQASCAHADITAFVSGDGCCPPGGNRRSDRDCPQLCGNGSVEPGESCDRAAVGLEACPTACLPAPSACLRRTLEGTAADCTARCAITRVTACGATVDGCCADGCTAATDPDCSPTCGDGVVQPANRETCDLAIAAGSPGACPRACNDGMVCTRDILVAAGTCQAACVSVPVTELQAGDGCCPPGGNAALDADCAPVCGNGVVEAPGETCDYAAAAGACPVTCPAGGACAPVRLEGAVGTCSAACVTHPITACVSGDGCCPPGCAAVKDTDCTAVCGDGVVSPGEACDRGITAGQPGACARSCADGDACTVDQAAGAVEGCSRSCSHARVTACLTGDHCCPPGCPADVDHDCAPFCGDGQLGGGETCDPPASCPVTCPDDGDLCTREQLTGDAAHCDVACQHVPLTACSGRSPDLCCPTGCTPATDVDCAAG